MDHSKTRKVDIAFILLILVSLAAMVNLIVLASQYYAGTSDQSVRAAEVYALDVQEKFEGNLRFFAARVGHQE